MKINKYILLCLVALSFMACTQDDANVDSVYDNTGQTGVGFTTDFTSTIVPIDGEVTETVTVQATTTSTADRFFDVSVDTESTGNPDDYTIGSVTIPAGSYNGTLDVTFGNFSNLPELVSQTLILNLDLPSGVAVVGSSSTEFSYLKFVVCNDMTLVLNEDNYFDERSWNITDSSGAIVVQCSDFPDDCFTGAASGSFSAAQYVYSFNLPDGCYTLTMIDTYGDGQFDGNTTGNYTLSCDVITHATGEGDWGATAATDFCVNQ